MRLHPVPVQQLEHAVGELRALQVPGGNVDRHPEAVAGCPPARQLDDRARSTQRLSERISAVFSASGMNSAGPMVPSSGCCQRSRASTEVQAPVTVDPRLVVQVQLGGRRPPRPASRAGGRRAAGRSGSGRTSSSRCRARVPRRRYRSPSAASRRAPAPPGRHSAPSPARTVSGMPSAPTGSCTRSPPGRRTAAPDASAARHAGRSRSGWGRACTGSLRAAAAPAGAP